MAVGILIVNWRGKAQPAVHSYSLGRGLNYIRQKKVRTRRQRGSSHFSSLLTVNTMWPAACISDLTSPKRWTITWNYKPNKSFPPPLPFVGFYHSGRYKARTSCSVCRSYSSWHVTACHSTPKWPEPQPKFLQQLQPKRLVFYCLLATRHRT